MTKENENLILDISSPEHQLVSYGGNQQVGFYDGYKAGKPALYIYIKNNSDRFTTVRRRATDRKVQGPLGDMQLVPETKLYSRAYNKYLEFKKAGGVMDAEKVVLKAHIAELEAKASKKEVKEDAVVEIKAAEKEEKVVEYKKTASDLKKELDALGIEYKGNASTESLLELLANS